MLVDPDLKGAVLLVMANKQDIEGKMSVDKITEMIGLNSLKYIQWFILATDATTGNGLFEGFDWLSQTLAKKLTK